MRRFSIGKMWSVIVGEDAQAFSQTRAWSGFLNEKRSFLETGDVQTSSASRRRVNIWRALLMYSPPWT